MQHYLKRQNKQNQLQIQLSRVQDQISKQMNSKTTQGTVPKQKTDNKLSFSQYEQRLSFSKNNNKKGKYASISANANVNKKQKQSSKNIKPQQKNNSINNNNKFTSSSINSYGYEQSSLVQQAKRVNYYQDRQGENQRVSNKSQRGSSFEQKQRSRSQNNRSFNQKTQNGQESNQKNCRTEINNPPSASPSKLDLIFEKQPEQVQQKLKRLLINYNAVMQYNQNQDKFQVDLLLPFSSSQQKQKFVQQFLKHREQLKQKQNQSNSKSKSMSKNDKKVSQNNSQNSSKHVENVKGQDVSDFVIENYAEYQPGQNILSESIRQQLKAEEQFVYEKQLLPIDFHQLQITINQRLQNSIEMIIQKKRQKQISKDQEKQSVINSSYLREQIREKEKFKKREIYQSQKDNTQKPINNNNFVSQQSKQSRANIGTVNFQSQKKSLEESKKPQQCSQSQIESDHHMKYLPNQPLTFKSPTVIKKKMQVNSSPNQIQDQNQYEKQVVLNGVHSPVQNFYESPIAPYKNQISRSNTSSNQILIEDGMQNSPYQYFQEQHDTQQDRLFSYRSPNQKQTNQHEYQNSYHSAMDIVEEKAQQYQEEMLPSNQNHKNFLKSKLKAFASVQPQPYFKKQSRSSVGNVNQTNNVKLPSRKQSMQRQKSLSNSKQSKEKSNQKLSLRKKYADFLKSNHSHLQKIYDNIKKDMRNIQNKKSELQQNSKESGQILVIDDENQGQDRIHQSTQSELKQQALQQYRQRIILQNDSMSSQDKVRYFKYLLRNAKKLYNEYMRGKKTTYE